jgi:hypothetical protein
MAEKKGIARSLLLDAVEILDSLAEAIAECEQVDGTWPDSAPEAEADYHRVTATADGIREALIADEADHV